MSAFKTKCQGDSKKQVMSTYKTQRAYAPCMDSLPRIRKLPSLAALERRSSAFDRVILPWYQGWKFCILLVTPAPVLRSFASALKLYPSKQNVESASRSSYCHLFMMCNLYVLSFTCSSTASESCKRKLLQARLWTSSFEKLREEGPGASTLTGLWHIHRAVNEVYAFACWVEIFALLIRPTGLSL